MCINWDLKTVILCIFCTNHWSRFQFFTKPKKHLFLILFLSSLKTKKVLHDSSFTFLSRFPYVSFFNKRFMEWYIKRSQQRVNESDIIQILAHQTGACSRLSCLWNFCSVWSLFTSSLWTPTHFRVVRKWVGLSFEREIKHMKPNSSIKIYKLRYI